METPRKPLKNIHLDAIRGTPPLKVPASPLMKTLGFGTGVNVYFLERGPSRSPWAIKRVSQRTRVTSQENSKLFNERIAKEAKILRQLQHPNIVGFRAVSKEKGDVGLALECCKTSLGSILEERLDAGENELPAKYIKKMLIDISSALDYLHSEAMLLHGDLKSHNILIKGDFEVCKLCDFGVCLPLNKEGKIDFRENPCLQYVGTTLWCAPEVIGEFDMIDSKADIFSLGLIIYETINLTPPHVSKNNNSTREDDSSLNFDDTERQSDEENDGSLDETDLDIESENTSMWEMKCGTRPALPQAFELTDEYNIIMELFYLCTNELPDDRPSAKIICDSLKKDALN